MPVSAIFLHLAEFNRLLISPMKRSLPALVVAFFLSPLGVLAKPSLAEYLPTDAWGVIEVENIATLQKEVGEGPFGKMWDSPAMKELKGYLLEEMMDFPEDEEGEATKELFDRILGLTEKFSGQAALSIGGLEQIVFEEKEAKADNPQIVFLAETDATLAELEELLEWMDETDRKVNKDGNHLRIEKTKVRGHQVLWLAPENQADDDPNARFGLFLIDGVLGVGGDRSVMEEVIERMAKGKGASFADNRDYRDAFDEIGRGDVRAFINFRPMLAMLDKMKDNPTLVIEENPLGVTTEGLFNAMKLDGLECYAMQMDFDRRGMEMSTCLYMSKKEGLLALFQSSEESVSPISFVPRDVVSASVFRYDLGQAWDTVMKMLQDVSPAMFLLIDGQIKVFESEAGVSLRKDVLGSLGDEIVSFSETNLEALSVEENLAPDEQVSLDSLFGEFYAIALDDGDRFDRSLRTLVGVLAPGNELFEESEHKGVVIRELRVETGMSFSYAVTPKWLFLNFGDRPRMIQAISRSQKPRKSLWSRADVAAAMEDLPNDYNQLGYSDFQGSVDMLGFLFKEVMNQTTGEKVDLSEMPEMPYFMLSWGKNSRRGTVSKSRLFPKDE
tara:strand:- start:1133 stop:2971 length:1839 start_codon:yes stop_codon:yes gene_type:complete